MIESSQFIYTQLSGCETKFTPRRDSNPWPKRYRCGARPTELSSQLLAVLDLRDIKYIQYLLYQISMSVLCMRARVRKMLIVLIVTTPTAVHVNKDSPEMVQSAGYVMAQTS